MGFSGIFHGLVYRCFSLRQRKNHQHGKSWPFLKQIYAESDPSVFGGQGGVVPQQIHVVK